MKKYFTAICKLMPLLILALLFSGCIKDTCNHVYTYTYYSPVYKTTAEVRGNIKSNAPQDIKNPGKIYILGNYIFLNEIDKGIHVIDNSNPASPTNVAFIDIPGNLDLAVKGTTLYADLYTDLVTIDISNPLNVSVKQYNEGVFPYRLYTNGFYGDSSKIIVDWIERDTTVADACGGYNVVFDRGVYYSLAQNSAGNKSASSSPVGQGGSMARFTIVNDRLYTVSYSDLAVFNIATPGTPVFTKTIQIAGWNIETIFPFKNKLFIGSQNGMFVYNINNPDNPALDGQFGHVQSCDPVIADDDYAYVTLRSGSSCQGFTNQLDILELNNLTDPKLVKSYSLTNPHGLSKDGDYLFICDGADGLKLYDAGNVNNLQLLDHIQGLETYDVIAFNHIALVVASDALYQYDYTDVHNMHLLSKMSILK